MTKSPSEAAIKQARIMARVAVKKDRWMTPNIQEYLGNSTDPGFVSDAHREGWEETIHFQESYGTLLNALACKDSGIAKDGQWSWPWPETYSSMDYHDSHYVPLKEAFWDEWEEKSLFYEKMAELTDANFLVDGGNHYWYRDGKLHRKEGPALELVFDGHHIKAVDPSGNGFLVAKVEVVESDHATNSQKKQLIAHLVNHYNPEGKPRDVPGAEERAYGVL